MLGNKVWGQKKIVFLDNHCRILRQLSEGRLVVPRNKIGNRRRNKFRGRLRDIFGGLFQAFSDPLFLSRRDPNLLSFYLFLLNYILRILYLDQSKLFMITL